MNGQQYRKPPWGSSKMTAMPPRQGDLAGWLCGCARGTTAKRKEDYGRHVIKPARAQNKVAVASCKLQAALRWSRDTEVVVS